MSSTTATAAAAAPPTEEYYLLKRDKSESDRLDFQHDYLTEICGGRLIHDSIREDQIFSVADVATGTGIWLRDLQQRLDTTYPVDSSNRRYYHGFDISSEQFPADNGDGKIHYSLQDCLKPFPAEHHNRYDLVHVRLLVAAFKEPEYKLAVANLVPLLKPGGYLQWEDLDLMSYLTIPEEKYQSLPSMNTLRMCINTQIEFGASEHVPAAVAAAAEAAGLRDVIVTAYRTKDKPELAATTQSWISRTLAILVGVILRRKNQASSSSSSSAAQVDSSDIDEEVRRRMLEVEDGYQKGLVMHGDLGMVVARKV